VTSPKSSGNGWKASALLWRSPTKTVRATDGVSPPAF
jgi:hypothetical protein